MKETLDSLNVTYGAIEHAVSQGAFTIAELKQIIPALDHLKHFIEKAANLPEPKKVKK